MEYTYSVHDDHIKVQRIGTIDLYPGEDAEEKARNVISMQHNVNVDDVELKKVDDVDDGGVITTDDTINKTFNRKKK